MDLHYYTKSAAHRSPEDPCQDRALIHAPGPYTLAVLADGVSAAAHGGEGAELACRAVADFLRLEGDNVFLYEPRKLAYLLTEHILFFLEQSTEGPPEDLRDYASTLVFLCTCRRTGETVVGSLGDGAVFRRTGSRLREVLAPRQFRGCPYVTTTENAYRYLGIKGLSLFPGESLLLCTDGFLRAAELADSRGISLEALITGGAPEALDGLLDTMELPDDVGYILCTRPNG